MELSRLTGNSYVKVTAALAAGVGTIALMAGCGSENLFKNGGNAEVIRHEYDDPDTYTTFILVGKVLVPVVHHDPAHWYLEVNQCGRQGDTHADANGCVEGTVEVTQQTYDQYADGSTIDLAPSR